jgi:hypothetical protein
MASTKDVLDHHLKCFGEGNLEGILSDCSPKRPHLQSSSTADSAVVWSAYQSLNG